MLLWICQKLRNSLLKKESKQKNHQNAYTFHYTNLFSNVLHLFKKYTTMKHENVWKKYQMNEKFVEWGEMCFMITFFWGMTRKSFLIKFFMSNCCCVAEWFFKYFYMDENPCKRKKNIYYIIDQGLWIFVLVILVFIHYRELFIISFTVIFVFGQFYWNRIIQE